MLYPIETFFRGYLNAAFKRLDGLLLQLSPTSPYFLGEQFSLADAAIATFILCLSSVAHFIDNDYKSEQVKASPRLAKFFEGFKTRPYIQETYYSGDEAYKRNTALQTARNAFYTQRCSL